MKFTSASLVFEVVFRMRQAGIGRGLNRAAIDRIANGFAPLTETERQAANAHTNVNFLDMPKLLADARRTYYGAYLKPQKFFNVMIDSGDPFKRVQHGNKITTGINRLMKKNKGYYESFRSRLAMTVEHGIGPGNWSDRQKWCPKAIGIDDVLIPANTNLSMDNLSHFAIYRQYTPMELQKIISSPRVDPAWKIPVVKAALKWAEAQTYQEFNNLDYLQPEKVEQRWKEDSGFYGTDAVPTINVWDFYFWSDEGKKAGWRRRMILDTPAGIDEGKTEKDWLYCPSDNRVYAESIEQILCFQFGDASAVGPFKYHTVRSLGWLLYSICHLQNRLRCKLNDAIFESMMQYFRTSNPDDKERITKIDLHNFGVVPEGIAFVTQQERWQVNSPLAELGLTLNRESMNESASQFREGRDSQQAKSAEKTATQVMAEVNAANAMVGTMLLQSYEYATFEYREICRRFCIKNSSDPDVREFRKNVLKAGVPEELLDSSMWNIEPEKVMGSGNKILEVAMADKLMSVRPLLDPDGARSVLHRFVAANSDDADYADQIVKKTPEISKTAQTASLMIGTLMAGVAVPPIAGLNAEEVVTELLKGSAMVLARIQQTGMPTMGEIIGLQTMEQAIGQWLSQMAQDESQRSKVKEFGAQLKELSGITQQLMQAVQEKAQQDSQQGGGVDPESAAKIGSIIATAKAKIQSKQESEAQKMEQKNAEFQEKLRQSNEQHEADLNKKLSEAQLTAVTKGIEAATKPKEEPKTE